MTIHSEEPFVLSGTWEAVLTEQFEGLLASLRAREADPHGDEDDVLIGLSHLGATVIHCLHALQRAPRSEPEPVT